MDIKEDIKRIESAYYYSICSCCCANLRCYKKLYFIDAYNDFNLYINYEGSDKDVFLTTSRKRKRENIE